MAGGCSNLLNGRRGMFNKCLYWNRDDDNLNLQEYTYKNKPSGYFYCEDITAETNGKQVINNVFMVDESNITLKSKDNISLKKGDIVKYMNELWMVVSSQTKRLHKNQQFMERVCVETYIEIKR